MIVTTTPDVPGRKITEILGIARGNSVRAKHVGRDIIAALRNIVGGEIAEYAKLQAETREMATRRMVEQAELQGADAVVNVRVVQPQGGTVDALATAGIRQQKRIISYPGFACRQAAGNEANLNFQLLA